MSLIIESLKSHLNHLREQHAYNERLIRNFEIRNETLEISIDHLETIIKANKQLKYKILEKEKLEEELKTGAAPGWDSDPVCFIIA